MRLKVLILFFLFSLNLGFAAPFTVIKTYNYPNAVKQSRIKIKKIIRELNQLRQYQSVLSHDQLNNALVYAAFLHFEDLPYKAAAAQGEGDWQVGSWRYKKGAKHVEQDPVYRTDFFNCQTLVQTIMGLVLSKNLNQFDKNILKIQYGSAGLPATSVHYYNRNNFISADFNPVNQRRHILKDVTSKGPLKKYSQRTSAIIDHNRWYQFQRRPGLLRKNVRVIDPKDGPKMRERFKTVYPNVLKKYYKPKRVYLSYIPKDLLVIKRKNKKYVANHAVLDLIPTPSVVEIVRDVKKWKMKGRNIKNIIGSGINVSHLGLLYRQTFHKNDIITQKISCRLGLGKKVCTVTPRVCHQKACRVLMMIDSTIAYPNGYYWVKQKDGYHCTAQKPKNTQKITYCNRVMAIPLVDYLTQVHYNAHIFMRMPAILGVHVEKLL